MVYRKKPKNDHKSLTCIKEPLKIFMGNILYFEFRTNVLQYGLGSFMTPGMFGGP